MHSAALRAGALALLLVGVAGCAQKASDPTLTQTHAGGAAASAAAPLLNATPAPAWTVGQSWTHKWTIGAAGNLTILVRTVVAEQAGDGWTLATDNQTIAAFHGAFIFPTLGHVSRGLLQSVGDTRFPWYHFPLAANQTWSDTLVTWDGEKSANVPVQGRVASVLARADGSRDYRVVLETKGQKAAEYDYDTATQWFDEARFYDDKGRLNFRIEMQETHAAGFKGRLYDDTGALLLNHLDVTSVAGQVAQPSPEQDFTMTGEQNRLLLFVFPFAAAGAHATEVVAPDGTHYDAQAVAATQTLYDTSNLFLVPGQAGTWRVGSAGAGVFVSGDVVQAYGLHERAIDV